jgi:hypothetical protein
MNYNNYPDIEDKDFNKKILLKKEFYIHKSNIVNSQYLKNNSSSSSFKLTNIQNIEASIIGIINDLEIIGSNSGQILLPTIIYKFSKAIIFIICYINIYNVDIIIARARH